MHKLVANHAEQFLPLVAVTRAVLDVLCADVDFFVVGIEIETGGVGYAFEGADDECHAAGGGAVGAGSFRGREVEQVEDVLDL